MISLLFCVEVAVKVLVVLGLTCVVAWALRSRSAATRHRVWSLGLTGSLALPLMAILLPTVDVKLLPRTSGESVGEMWASSAPQMRPESNGQETLAATGETRSSNVTQVSVTADLAGRWIPRWPVVVWMVVAVTLCLRLVGERWRLGRLASTAEPVLESELLGQFEFWRRQVGVGPRVQVATSSVLPIPVTWGFLRSVILLPAEQATWSESRRRSVLLHELAHVKHWDYAWNLVGLLACAVHWYNPFVWLAYRRMTVERERAADDCVLRQRIGVREYAEHLLDLVRDLSRRQVGLGVVSAMADRVGLRGRVEALLEEGRPRNAVSRSTALVAGLMALMLIGPLAAAQLKERQVAERGAAKVRGAEATAEDVAEVRGALADLRDVDPAVRRRAAWVLGDLESSMAVTALVGRLGDSDAGVRAMAAWALGEIKDLLALEALHAALVDADPYVREMVVLAIGELEQPQSVELLLGLLDDEDLSIRTAAIWALGEIRTEAALDAVAAELRDPDEFVRHKTLGVLLQTREPGSLKSSRSRVGALLLQVLAEDESADLRWRAARALRFVEDASGVAALVAALSDDEAVVRKQAAMALGHIERDGVAAELVEILEDPNAEVRLVVAQSLGRLRDVAAVDGLIACLRDEVPEVRRMAVWALDEIRQQ